MLSGCAGTRQDMSLTDTPAETKTARNQTDEKADSAEDSEDIEASTDDGTSEAKDEEVSSTDPRMDSFQEILNQYKEAQDGAYSMDEVMEMGLDTELIQFGWPYASSEDAVKYLYYDIDSDDADELIITYFDDIADIWGYDGKKARLAYSNPYRGITELHPGGMLSCAFSISAGNWNTTWYQYDSGLGDCFPVFQQIHDEEEGDYYYTFCFYDIDEVSYREIEESYRNYGYYPEWTGEWGDQLTGSEYEDIIPKTEAVRLPEGNPLSMDAQAGNIGNQKKDVSNNMSEKERRQVEKKLNSIGYYGFMLSTYTDPTEIDWNEVFYAGAGLDPDNGSPSAEIKKAYLEETGDEEIYTDLTVISGRDVKDYVKKTTGHDYSEMKNPLDWVYLKDYDLYANEHGDTNQIRIEATAGHYENGEYTITYTHISEIDYCVTFTDEGGTYRFISNVPQWFAIDPTNGGDVDQTTITDGMLLPDSDSRKLTEEDLAGLRLDELRIARNEIYARHGRKFADSKLQEYFDQMDWYFPSVEPEAFDESILNEIERYNLIFIREYEKKKE